MGEKKKEAIWLVWNQGGFPPNYRHETEESACAEAERLALNNPGVHFIVLEAKQGFIHMPVMKFEFAKKTGDDAQDDFDDDIPF